MRFTALMLVFANESPCFNGKLIHSAPEHGYIIMKKFKKWLSVILAFIMILSTLPVTVLALDSTDLEPGKIKIQLNLIDWNTGEPLPYVTMTINAQGDPAVDKDGIIILTSDKNGIAYAEVPYTTRGTKTYINNGTDVIFDSAHSTSLYLRFDMGALTPGYDYDLTVTKKIRNATKYMHASKVEKAAGSSVYDDFCFDGGMPTHGACVEFDVYLKKTGSTEAVVSFDTSTIANASDFTPITVSRGNSLTDEGKSIPTAINSVLSNCPLVGWTCNGFDFDLNTNIGHNITLTPKWASMCTVTFDTSKVSNAEDFPAQGFMGTGYATEPSATPVNSSDPGRTFLHWALNGEAFDFANTPVTDSITLTPVWEAEGVIHFKVYMWDHEYYVAHGQPGEGDHRADGQTKIPIDGVRMVLKTYPGSDGGSEGTPAAADWNNSWNGMIEDSRKSPVGRPGGAGAALDGVVVNYNSETGAFEGDYVISADQLQYLKPGYVIDTDPDNTVIGQYNRAVTDPNYTTQHGIGYHDYTGITTFGNEATVFDWDWYTAGEDRSGAGNTGVRVIPEARKHGGSIPNGTNLNDVAQISQDMIDNGFEFTFVCYVVPAVVVLFDSNGGQPDYPMQKFKPVNSIPVAQQEFKATNPGSPTKTDKVFAGWYEVIGQDEFGEDVVAQTPWDFNRVVSHTMTLKALYTDRLYTVTWKNEAGTQVLETDHYRLGDIPYYDGAIPVKSSTVQYDYVFAGWELVDPAGDSTVHPGRNGTTVGGDQVYEARFEARLKNYAVKWVDWNWNAANEFGLIEEDEAVAYGSTAHFDGTEPVRATVDGFAYTFAGWKKISPTEGNVFTGRDGETVQGDQIYQAQYTKTFTGKTLTVQKVVNGPDDGRSFAFELTVLNSDDSIPDFSSRDDLPTGVTLKAGTTNVLCFSLIGGGSIEIDNILLTGTKLTLTETSHSGYLVSMAANAASYDGDSHTFVLNEHMTVTVTNTPVFYVVHHAEQGSLSDVTDTIPLYTLTNGRFDITAPFTGSYAGFYTGIRSGYLYGGLATSSSYNAPVTNENGKSLRPTAGKTYYLREVSVNYLRPANISVLRKKTDTVIERYMMTVIDANGFNYQFYTQYGFLYELPDDGTVITNFDTETGTITTGPTEEIYSEITAGDDSEYKNVYSEMSNQLYRFINIQDYAQNTIEMLTPDGLFDGATEDDFIGCLPYDSAKRNPETLGEPPIQFTFDYSYCPYYVTADGVLVIGDTQRYVQMTDGELNIGAFDLEIEPLKTYECTLPSGGSVDQMKAASARVCEKMLTENPIRLNVMADGRMLEFKDFAGDFTELVKLPENGKKFKGLYTDDTYTTPADLTDVVEDMTVYAKYVENLKTIPMFASGKRLRVTLNVDDMEDTTAFGVDVLSDGVDVTYEDGVVYVNGTMVLDEEVVRSGNMPTTLAVNGAADGASVTVNVYRITTDGQLLFAGTSTYICRDGKMEMR